jgi:aspartyl-tRNA(Asn)/glutamyl-tRNA(Gln) amidotransferase subunit A
VNSDEIPFLSVAETAQAVREKRFSPTEVTEAYLQRIERLNPSLNAYITVTADLARAQAKETEKHLMAGDTKGPLFGVPVAVKDQFWTKGIRTTCNSTAYKDFVPNHDATVITRLQETKAILLGKLHLELGSLEENSPPWPACRNPWDPDRHPGGSSTGSAVALSTYLCGASVGEDTGGSGRFPASWSGVVGMRPTYGRVSRYGMFPFCWYLDVAAPMGRTVEDVALILEAVAGYDSKDPYTSKRSVPQYSASLGKPVTGIRIGLIREFMTKKLDPEVRHLVENAAKKLEGLGAEVVEVSIPMMSLNGPIHLAVAMPEAASYYAQVLREHAHRLRKTTRILLRTKWLLPVHAINTALKARALLRKQVLDTFERFDILLSPTTCAPAPMYDDFVHPTEIDERLLTGIAEWVSYCSGYSQADMPAISVPCGFTSGKRPLPVGMQLAARPFAEDRLLQVAHAYQQATNWHTKLAPAAMDEKA